ncbi:tRNA (adenosine(37)-N6)-dimethylallyltransferase MiaA [Dyella sp. 333MFSha]|uniref:tRNA (adenosine(37)-N6)-dimethylallyltransferase MiaA n=1 Tax=Dyella sp. 333MFSha TaxID=1798240 RepID=UPI000886C605|nr:tRNA (adenosine(37)-N6)-dimethylallyltransferase MiaA [Dyella sp. 333MFSha]SDF23014.1 tRNA dimethylallyltransferase [Dyella sp. 333MFSha]
MTLDHRPLAVFLMGPTASGKTALACSLADRYPMGLISVDSALVYRGLDIGSAKPDAATLARYPHELVDIRDPAQPYSAADFRSDALAAMDRVRKAGRVPLLVGGTGLYFRALQQGLSDLPEADPAVRERIGAEAARVGWATMHERMAERDPVAGARIRPGDAQRVQRALEVMELTGRTLTELQQGGSREPFPWRVLKLALLPDDRKLLHERIAARFDTMIAGGFLDEVKRLRARGDLHAELPAIRAVGYRQAWEYLDGQGDATNFRDRGIYATRQLAKRQITWLRGELDARTFDPDRGDPLPGADVALQQFLGVPRASRTALPAGI